MREKATFEGVAIPDEWDLFDGLRIENPKEWGSFVVGLDLKDQEIKERFAEKMVRVTIEVIQ